eukprot:2732771-Pyramimonas_sp.AAC.1
MSSSTTPACPFSHATPRLVPIPPAPLPISTLRQLTSAPSPISARTSAASPSRHALKNAGWCAPAIPITSHEPPSRSERKEWGWGRGGPRLRATAQKHLIG